MSFTMFITCLILFLVFSFNSGDNLIASVMVFRHGERTPRIFYPNDPYKNTSYWPVPFGELTQNGISQAYELGKWARQRYNNILPKVYASKDFFIYSSSIDRTLMSASAFAAGLYPNTHNRIPFQPVPIHSKPSYLDNTIISEGKPCPKQKLLVKEILKEPYFMGKDKENKELYTYLTEYMGITIDCFLGVEVYYDTFFIEELNNLTLPVWTKNIYPEKLKKAANLNLIVYTYTRELAKLKIGALYSEILAYLTSFTDNPSEFDSDFEMQNKGRKLMAISGHDTNIAALLNTMGVTNLTWPPYSSSVVFELKKNSDSSFYVNLFYKNGKEVSKIILPSCSFNCKLDNLIEYFRPIVMSPKKWDDYCAS